MNNRQLVLDTETTGTQISTGNRVIEIGVVEIINRKITTQTFHSYLNPGRDSEPGALAVHGLKSDFLKDKPLFPHIIKDLLHFLGDSELIIHNAPFDVSFLNEELKRANHPPLKHYCSHITDTLLMARRMHPGKKNSLDALCARYNVDNSQRTFHGALKDSYLLAHVYLGMTKGQELISFHEESPIAPSLKNRPTQQTLFSPASEEEEKNHQYYLDSLEEKEKLSSLWRKIFSS